MITASALPRLAICPASNLLAHEDYSTQDAVDGTARHAEREALVLAGRTGELPEAVAALIQPGDLVLAEVALAYSPSKDATRILGRGIGRDYRVTGDEVPGTADLVIVGRGRLVVGDWKGHRDNGSREQVYFYALALARYLGAESLTIVVHYESGRVVTTGLDDLELDAFAAELRTIIARASDPTAPTKTGPGCKYCPAFAACPEQRALAAQAAGESLWLRVESTSLANDDTARDFYDLTERVGALYKRMRAKLAARAEDKPIPLGGGKVYGYRPTKGSDALDADIVYDEARKLYGQAFADDAVTREATKAAIKRAAKKHGMPEAATERAVVDAVKARGGVKNEPGRKLEEHTPTTRETEAA